MSTTEKQIATTLDDRAVLRGFSRVRVSMVVSDPYQEDCPIVYVNDAFCRMTGYTRADVIGKNCRFMQGEATQKRDVDQIRHAIAESRATSVDILNYRANGEPFINRLVLSPISDDTGKVRFYLGIQKELGEHERSGNAATQSNQLGFLRERVTSDLSLLLRAIPEPDKDGLQEFESLNRRMDCLQLAYEEMMLHDTQVLDTGLDLGALLSRIGAAITHENSRPGVRYAQHIDRVQADLETGIQVSLLVSELLANSYSHAFKRLDHGYVQLQVANLEAGGMRITVSDDGLGIPKSQTFPDTSTRGGRLINDLLEGLDTTLNIVRGAAGTVFIIEVPLND